MMLTTEIKVRSVDLWGENQIWPIEYLTNWKTGGKKCYIDKGMLIVQLNPNEGYEGMKESVPS